MNTSGAACITCGSADLSRRPAVVSAFISEYALGKPVTVSGILECRDCTMQFYEIRPTDEEMVRLYTGYRTEAYFNARHKHEFWYTHALNTALGSEKHMPVRRRVMLDMLARHRDLSTFINVLDYGGDRGQMLQEGPGKSRFVFDISAVPPEPHIAKIAKEQDLAPAGYDLIVLCHVLEHLPHPAELLIKLKTLLSPGGLLFIELPVDNFNIKTILKANWYEKYLLFLIRHSWLFSFVSLYSLVSRRQFARIPPLGFASMHEHINLFTQNALKTCLVKYGYNVLETGIDPRTGNLYAIAQSTQFLP